MSAKTVTIDHPHAEVIAAFYSGKTVQYKDEYGAWHDWGVFVAPEFSPNASWRIKPEPLVKWLEIDADGWATGRVWATPHGVALKGCRVVRMVEQPE